MGDFNDWLTEELTKRGWSYSELGRRGGLSQVAISNVLSDKRKPGVTFCHKIAQALNESPEKILRLAGILPPAQEGDTLQELIDLIRTLSPEDQADVLQYVRFRRQNPKT